MLARRIIPCLDVKNGRVDRIVRNENPMPVEEIEW